MLEKNDELINRACDIYMRFGIKSITMDDMARHLSISKKTLYKHVKDKGDLVEKTIELKVNHDLCCIQESCATAKNAIEEHFMISKSVISQMKDSQPAVFYDLKKYYPKAWNIYQTHKNEAIHKTVTNNMGRGQKEGLYRKDVNIEITASLYIQSVDVLFSDEIVSLMTKYNFQEIIVETLKYHIYGISTEKGIVEFNKLLKNVYE